VDLPTALLRDLFRLASSVDLGLHALDDGLEPSLLALVSDLRSAVPSYLGLDLRMVESGHPVTLTAFLPFADETIVTSIRISLAALGDGLASGSRMVCYAGVPGAFVDLAADLGYALGSPTSTDGDRPRSAGPEGNGQHEVDGHRCGAIALDADLPPSTLASGITGLEELSTINRAIGMLIEQGHTLHDAQAALHRRAVAVGVESHTYAARLLGREGP
jgi:hypothetical protein